MVELDLASALNELTKDRGILRSDLKELLDGELRILRDCWHIDTTKSSSFVRDSVARNLLACIEDLKPPRMYGESTPDEKQKKYLDIVKVCYNVVKHPELAEQDFAGRQKWLLTKYGEKRRVSRSTVGRYLDTAIKQIEDQICAPGYEPKVIIAETVEDLPLTFTTKGQTESDASNEQRVEGTASHIQPKQPLISPRQAISLGLAAFVIVFASAIVYGQLHKGRAPSAPASPPAFSTAIAAANPANLSVTLDTVADAQSGHSVVFPSPTDAATQRYTAQTSVSTDSESLMERELRDGAYALGGLDLNVNLDSTNQSELTVYRIEPVNIHRSPALTGAVMAWGAQGGGNTRQMYFDLDNLEPVPKTYDNTAHTVGGPFFESQRIGVSATKPQTLEMYFVANQGSYLFDIKVDYELDHKQYGTTLNFNGKPFAVTADLCKPGAPGNGARGTRSAYQLVRYVSEDPSSLGKVLTLDPTAPCTGL